MTKSKRPAANSAEICRRVLIWPKVIPDFGGQRMLFQKAVVRLSIDNIVMQADKTIRNSSPNAFDAYEQGRMTPKLDTFTKYLETLGSDVDLVLVPKKRKKKRAA